MTVFGAIRVGAAGWLLSLVLLSAAEAQNAQSTRTYDVVSTPSCSNNKGETVQFVDTTRGRPGFAAGMAVRNSEGHPIVLRSNFSATPPEFQSFIDRHECAHHQIGDIDRPHPPRNSPEHLMNEAISDCVAILRLRDEEGYDNAGLQRVTTAMRSDMARIGFPEISISSRISNINNCYANHGPPREFIGGILKQRGLPQL